MKHAFLALCCLFPVACHRSQETAVPFPVRLQAADRITSSSERDSVCADIAREAAKQGDAVSATRGINMICSSSERDDAAADAAVLLAKAGNSEAINVAGLICNSSRRDEVLIRIAKGS